MQIINTTDLNKAKKEIQTFKKEKPKSQIVVQAQDEKFNRKILENKDVDIFLDPHTHNRKEYLKQRDSGLNEFLCKLAKENNIKIGIDISKLTKLEKKQKSKILARIIQNIKLCKRTKTQIILFPNTHKKQDILSFFISLKGSTEQAKQAFN